MRELRTRFLAPSAVIVFCFFFVPFVVILVYSFLSRGSFGGVQLPFSGENYARLLDPLYGVIFFRTLWMASSATAVCLLLGFPLALFISRSGRRKNLWLQLLMLPFWSSFLVRMYAWLFLLRDTGLVNTALQSTGAIREPLFLLYNDGAVLLGLVSVYLPFAVLPLYASLERLDHSLVEAAADLGASSSTILLRVTAPLCAPGFRAGALLVFAPCFGAYLTPDLLGGGRSVMAGNLIQNQFTTARDWPFGAAVSLAMMAILLCLLAGMSRKQSGLL